jgi:hypothetical protein
LKELISKKDKKIEQLELKLEERGKKLKFLWEMLAK